MNYFEKQNLYQTFLSKVNPLKKNSLKKNPQKENNQWTQNFILNLKNFISNQKVAQLKNWNLQQSNTLKTKAIKCQI
jgi:hypothetical protein